MSPLLLVGAPSAEVECQVRVISINFENFFLRPMNNNIVWSCLVLQKNSFTI